MNLSEKYRPRCFSEMIGDYQLFEILAKKSLDKTISHSIMLTGDTGSGKTTSAKIIAMNLGASVDNIIKINASDDNGVNTAREIIESMKYPALDRGPKVFLIDEIQKTSTGFQDALLDPLEHIPDYVYFLFCTSNPEKLQNTFR